MKIVKLMTCDSATQAHIIQGALQNEGIDSMLRNENMSTLLAGLQVSNLTGVDILVNEENYEAAINLLEQNQMIPEQLRYCPFCGSSDIKFVLRKGHRLRAVAAAVASLLAGAAPGTNHWEYVCNQCKGRFEKPVAKKHQVIVESK
ncbi:MULTISPECIES: DUF2007 domain-containing protein [Bacteroides]|uniref:putative signal transducing protein n=1 Tax=Bacteroides TaxID=816 RepID=UPI000E441128|nr:MULTISPECIES: DUF2007 domain-containing protein [Bacteroides]MBS7573337.1 DUF2007 domain-containing protein [Bacteroides propionicigenes]RGM30925.1 DUF2007 domain-containing protein [Bacteroides sp. OM08-17BH]RHJ54115.1 DUF2007 domain-containing protein [Bacteroides sp. AM10-21B]HBO08004.1 hypothetical protein [Bacteroides sp.]